MLNKIKYLVSIFFMILLIIFCGETYAASANLTISTDTATVGDTITITVAGNAASWQLSLSGGISETISDVTDTGENENVTMGTYTYTTTKEGEISFTLTGKVVNSDYSSQEISPITKTVTVKAKEQEPTTPTEPETPSNTETPTTPEGPQTPTEPEKPAVTEPTFKAVNETVYAEEEVNVRKGASISAEKVGRLAKGESVTRIGLGSNGWSKVEYKGATAYISSNYLTTTKPEEEEKSNNAYLKSLTIEGQEILPVFDKETTSYTLQVTNDITELNITAEPEDEKATIEIQGNKDLKEGENTVTISVNAEDNTIKIYEITVTKSEKIALGLKSLKIEDTDIEKTFRTDLYNYEIDIEDVTELEIEAIANDETATVEILGNEDLQEGENTITIIVSSQDGEEKVTYQIKANKIIEIAGTVAVNENKEIDPKIYLYIGLGAVVLIALIIVIVYTIKHRNEDEYEYMENVEALPSELQEKQEEKHFEYDISDTQELNIQNDQQDRKEDRKNKIDYFLDDIEDDERQRNRKGKHF